MKVLCIIDRPGWCWEVGAKAVAKHSRHDITIVDAETIKPALECNNHDLVWCRALPYFCGDWLYGLGHDTPVVWTFTSGNHLCDERVEKCLPYLRKAAGIICQNSYARQYFAMLANCPVVEITNGIDCEQFAPVEPLPSPGIVGMAANVTGARAYFKGLPQSMHAAKCAGLQIVYTGKAPTWPFLPQTGHEHMPAWYNAITYYCQPSTAEGCSNSVWEAMACGRVCLICRDVGWHGENCVCGLEHESGQVVYVRQDPGDILEKLQWLEDHPDDVLRISQNARRMAEEWQWSRIAGMLDNFFEETRARKK